jgi:hypothetical protein
MPENGVAKLDLLDLSAEDRNALVAGNGAAAAAAAKAR